jgi:hypothetical protein
MNRRNLSRVFIFHKFEDENKRQPTCFEDCPVEKQDEWLSSLNREAVENLAKHLAFTLKTMAEEFNIIADYDKEEVEICTT